MWGRKKHEWLPASGTVTNSRVAKASTSESAGTSVTRDFVVEVRLPGSEPFSALVPTPRTSDFYDPRIGAVVKVEVDAETHQVRFDRSDESLSFKAYEKAQQAAIDRQLRDGG